MNHFPVSLKAIQRNSVMFVSGSTMDLVMHAVDDDVESLGGGVGSGGGGGGPSTRSTSGRRL